MTVKEYLHQFTPEQWAEAYASAAKAISGEPDGWRFIAPIWMQNFEQPGMVIPEEIRAQGGFR